MTNLAGKQLGKYLVKERVGRGAMAEVYRAHQPGLERDVAIKVIHSHLAHNREFIERFKHEAKIIAALRHPGIVQVHDFDVSGDTFYMVMEFVSGQSLQDYLAGLHRQGERMPPSEVLRLFRLITGAVAYAHSQKVIHRDLKPGNVLLTPQGQPVLTDFGLSKIMGLDRLSVGAIVGTPTYMSPEQAAGQPGNERSDIYSLGVILYEMATGTPPFTGPRPVSIILKHLDELPPPPRIIAPDIPEALQQVILTALEKDPAHRFRSAQEMLDALPQTAGPNLETEPPPLLDTRCPYRGLQAFEAEHAEFFFGREALIHRLVESVSKNHRSRPFLAVLGASGSGKSSLVRAGLVPALRNAAAPGSNRWQIQIMEPGEDPLAELAAGLAPLLANGADPAAIARRLHNNLLADGRALYLAVRQAWPDDDPHRRLFLVVDQFEELFTLCRHQQARQRFIENLLYATAVGDSRVMVLLTLRADFYHRCAEYPELAGRLSTQHLMVGEMTETELRRAIEKPAWQVGLKFEPGLVDAILADVSRQPGALPLLQHALLELWERRQGARLTLAAYQASGGVTGAIARRAEDLFAGFSPQEQTVVRQIMLRLTQPGEGTEDTRRRARKQELLSRPDKESSAAVETVLQQLVNARLLTTGRDSATGEEMVDVSHEALIRGWSRLRGWLDEDRAALRTHRQLTEAAAEWRQNRRDAGYLYRGGRLAQAEEWAEAHPGDLNEQEWAFLEASRAAARAAEEEKEAARRRELAQAQALAREQQQRAEAQLRAGRRLRTLAAGLALVFLVAVIAAVIARNQQQTARQLAATAEARREIAETSQTEAMSAEATAEAERVEAERLARIANARQLAAQAQSELAIHPQRSLLLALEALQITQQVGEPRVPAAEQALREALGSIQGHVLTGHTRPLSAVAISPNNRWLVTAGVDKTARLWDLTDLAAPPVVLSGHQDEITAIAVSPNSRWLATASKDQTARLWDLTDPSQPPAIFSGRQDAVSTVAISPNNRWLVTGGKDATARLWNLNNPAAAPVVLSGHKDEIVSTAISPNGRWLATGSADQTTRLWNLNNPAASPRVLSGHQSIIHTLAFSPDNRWLATASWLDGDNTVRLWDLDDPAAAPTILTGHTSGINQVAFSANGRWLATAGSWPDNTARLWSMDDLTAAPFVFTGHAGGLETVTFSPDNRWLVTGSSIKGDNTVRVWNLNDPTAPPTILTGHDGGIWAAAISPDSRWLVTGSEDHTARVWDLQHPTASPAPVVLAGHQDAVLSATFSRDNRWLITGSTDHTARVWDVDNPAAAPTILTGHDDQINAVAVSPDNRWLATGSHDTTVRLWDMQNLPAEPVVLRGHTAPIHGVAFSPDNRWLASGSVDRTVRLWDMQNLPAGAKVLTGHQELVLAVAFSPNSRYLASGGLDKTVRLWDLTDLAAAPVIFEHNDTVSSLAISPDNRHLVTGSWDTLGRVWDLTDPSAGPVLLSGHDSGLSAVAVSPDNRWLVTASGDKTARLWDLTDLAAPPIVLTGHGSVLSAAAISPDNHWLATGSWDKTARLWNLRLDELAAQACRISSRNLTAAEWEKFFPGQPYRPTCSNLPAPVEVE